MSKSNYLENKVLDHVLGGGDFTRPATVYIALSTTDPTPDGAGTFTEPSGNNYSRLAVTNNSTNFPAASSGAKSNGVDFTFATPSGTWGTITHFAVFDASSAGNMLFWAELTTPKTINSGDEVLFPAGDMDFVED